MTETVQKPKPPAPAAQPIVPPAPPKEEAGMGINIWIGKLGDVLREVVNLGPIKAMINWGRLYSLWPVHLTTACCSVEQGAMMNPRYDPERFGVQMVAGSLRQCDLLIVEGTVTKKMAKRLKEVYDQMANPRYVIAMGDCAISGGLFWNSYNTIRCEDIIPVDVYVPGCPPRPEAVINGVIMLQEKIRRSDVFPKNGGS